MPKKVTVYLGDELAEVIEDHRRAQPVIMPLSKAIASLLVDGLPSGSRLDLHRMMRAKREGTA